MPAVIDKALDFIGAMDISASTPSSMNESTAKGIFKCLKDLGVPASADDIIARGNEEGWNPEFTQKMVRWAKKMESGERVMIKTRNILRHICMTNSKRWYSLTLYQQKSTWTLSSKSEKRPFFCHHTTLLFFFLSVRPLQSRVQEVQ